jgi:hypothetical protein
LRRRLTFPRWPRDAGRERTEALFDHAAAIRRYSIDPPGHPQFPGHTSSPFGRRRSVNVIAGLGPAIGSGTESAKMPLNRTAIAGTDPRNKSEDDEKAFGPAKMSSTPAWRPTRMDQTAP